MTGVMVQGGFYEDLTGILITRQETWVPEFAVSYAEYEGRRFQYMLYDGAVQVRILRTQTTVQKVGIPGCSSFCTLHFKPHLHHLLIRTDSLLTGILSKNWCD